MKYIYSSEGAGEFYKRPINRWVGCILGLVLFVSATGSVAFAQSSAMTQGQYLQWMATVCGDRLSSSATGQDIINWARGKGMTPTGGWQLNAKLTKEVVAQTVVQLLHLAPRKGNWDAVRILEREGLIITSNNGLVGFKDMANLVINVGARAGNGNGNPKKHIVADEDDVPTPTKPGNGPGGSGPPPQSGIFPGNRNGKGQVHFPH